MPSSVVTVPLPSVSTSTVGVSANSPCRRWSGPRSAVPVMEPASASCSPGSRSPAPPVCRLAPGCVSDVPSRSIASDPPARRRAVGVQGSARQAEVARAAGHRHVVSHRGVPSDRHAGSRSPPPRRHRRRCRWRPVDPLPVSTSTVPRQRKLGAADGCSGVPVMLQRGREVSPAPPVMAPGSSVSRAVRFRSRPARRSRAVEAACPTGRSHRHVTSPIFRAV
jgi:hypothetical protein